MPKLTSTLAFVAIASIGATIGLSLPRQNSALPSTPYSAQFGFRHTGGGTNCIVYGDTAWIAGVKVRIADIDAPETHPSHCAREAELGNRATTRLAELMNAGPFQMTSVDRDEGRYGRKLRVLVRDGQSLGGPIGARGHRKNMGRRPTPMVLTTSAAA